MLSEVSELFSSSDVDSSEIALSAVSFSTTTVGSDSADCVLTSGSFDSATLSDLGLGPGFFLSLTTGCSS